MDKEKLFYERPRLTVIHLNRITSPLLAGSINGSSDGIDDWQDGGSDEGSLEG